ncbi:MAG TPA: glycosyltransferase [Candidatus Limnocylindrales bacterium]|nr:glycosyltransferase [Candidatus Limnocylindrales bacterium]
MIADINTAFSSGAEVAPLDDSISARVTLTRPQRSVLILGALLLAALLAVAPFETLTGLVAVVTLLYVAAFVYRLRLFWGSLTAPRIVSITDAEARAIPDAELPAYTILVPAYREPEVISRLLAELDRLEYPKHKLDIKLLLEMDDLATWEAALAAAPGPHVEIIRVPPKGPKTKPNACNVGLARARGRYVTIFDAEDRPEPLQLRKAVLGFRRVDSNVACLQARLTYYNGDQNLLTRWFATEYAMWFSQLLPGLVARRAPVPLGGTSNHFRRDILVQLGGWDPYNVTEDADLGIRLHRHGLRTEILDSETFEEANSDFINWQKQRSRWYKGYLQTWLVHMRSPRALLRDLGVRGFVGFSLFVGGTPLLALINPLFWVMTLLWFLAAPAFIAALFPWWLYYLASLCLLLGNATFFYTTLVSARLTNRPGLVLASLLVPIYWVMMSIAALKAAIQLVTSPSFWEKTAHGLDRPRVPPVPSALPDAERPAA